MKPHTCELIIDGACSSTGRACSCGPWIDQINDWAERHGMRPKMRGARVSCWELEIGNGEHTNRLRLAMHCHGAEIVIEASANAYAGDPKPWKHGVNVGHVQSLNELDELLGWLQRRDISWQCPVHGSGHPRDFDCGRVI